VTLLKMEDPDVESSTWNNASDREGSDIREPLSLPPAEERAPENIFKKAVCGPSKTRKYILIFLFIVAAISFIVTSAYYIIPIVVQNTIDETQLELNSVSLTNVAPTMCMMTVKGTLQKSRGIAATLHETVISVYSDVDVDKEAESSALALQNLTEAKVGEFVFPRLESSGLETPLDFETIFLITDVLSFEELTANFITTGEAHLNLVGKLCVTTVGRTICDLLFSKVFVISGPKLGGDSDSTGRLPSNDSSLGGIRLLDYSLYRETFATTSLRIHAVIELNSTGKISITPLGDVTFDLWWNQLWLGYVTGKNMSLLPGSNVFDMDGYIDPMGHDGVYNVVTKMKFLTQLWDLIFRKSPVKVTVVGRSCSIPLYDAAIKSINTSFEMKLFHNEETQMVMRSLLSEVRN